MMGQDELVVIILLVFLGIIMIINYREKIYNKLICILSLNSKKHDVEGDKLK